MNKRQLKNLGIKSAIAFLPTGNEDLRSQGLVVHDFLYSEADKPEIDFESICFAIDQELENKHTPVLLFCLVLDSSIRLINLFCNFFLLGRTET